MPVSTSAVTSATTPPTSRPTATAVAHEIDVPRDRLVLMNQVHGADVVAGRRAVGRGAASGRRNRHARHRISRSVCWSPTVSRCCCTTLAPASSGRCTPVGPACSRASSAGPSPRCATSARVHLGDRGAVGLRTVLRGARRRWLRTAADDLCGLGRTVLDRHAGHRRGRRRRRAARCGRRGRAVGPGLHPRERRPLLLPARRPHRSIRRPGRAAAGGRMTGAPSAGDEARRDELRDGLAAVRERIERGCAEAGRDPDDVTLVVVTKYFPTSDVLLLHELGVRHFGENRDQEAGEKFREVRHALVGGRRRSRRPSTSSAGCRATRRRTSPATPTSSSPSTAPKLVAALAKGAHAADRPLEVLLQVSLDGDTSRGGVLPGDVDALADAVAAQQILRPARRHGRRAAGSRPRRGLRPAARGRGRHTCAGTPVPTGSRRG